MIDITNIIKVKLNSSSGCTDIPLLRGYGTFHVQLRNEGVSVNNLYNTPFLEWQVFEKVIELLEREGGQAVKGDSMKNKLGGEKLSISSVEGYIAKEVYNKKIGDSVFRRITPVVNILIWAGVCKNGKGVLLLK